MKRIIISWHFNAEKYNSEDLKFAPKEYDCGDGRVIHIVHSVRRNNEGRSPKEQILDILDKWEKDEIEIAVHRGDILRVGSSSDFESYGNVRACCLFSGGVKQKEGFIYEVFVDEYDSLLKESALSIGSFDRVWDEIRRRWATQSLDEPILRFAPLHFALQAFWGITYVKPQDMLVKFYRVGGRRDIPDEMQSARSALPELLSVENYDAFDLGNLFPNLDAFRLIDKSQCDFYIPLFDLISESGELVKALSRITEVSDNGVKLIRVPKGKEVAGFSYHAMSIEESAAFSRIKGESLEELLEKIQLWEENDTKEALEGIINILLAIENISRALGLHNKGNRSKPWFKIESDSQLVEIHHSDFVSYLRELCAILANVEDARNDKIESTLMAIASSLEVEMLKPHRKNEKLAYSTLEEQLTQWGAKAPGTTVSLEKPMAVIAGLHVMVEEFRRLMR